MEELFASFAQVVSNPREWLLRWKADSGKKVIGCLPMYVPEEPIHAAGMLPVVLQGSDRPIDLAHQHLHPYLCHPVRGNFELAMRGELDFADGLVFPDLCDQAKRVASVWKLFHQPPFFFHLVLPKRVDTPLAKDYLVAELKRFKAALERFSGNGISEDGLRQSIALYNRHRALLGRLYELRRESPGSFTAPEVATIVIAAMLMPKEEHNRLLEHYLQTKEKVPAERRVKLVVAGNLCEDVEPGFLEVVEGAGVMVDDDLYMGSRYFVAPVREDGDPLEALAGAHVSLVPCHTRSDLSRDPGDYLLEVVKRSGAEGVIILLQKYCEIHGFDYPLMKRKLDEAGVPHLLLETDHSGASGRVKTRLEAFVEMIRER